MSKQIKIDKERLEALKRRLDAAFSSAKDSGEKILAIHTERSLVISEISRIKSDVNGGVKPGHGTEQKSATVAPA